VFLNSGEETASVDALQYVWSGIWPTNRSPRLEGTWLDGKTAQQNVRLKTNETYTAKVSANDPDHDSLTYAWEILAESAATTTGGDFEAKPKAFPELITDSTQGEISLKAPATPGAYRLFVYVRDGKNHAAHANIPFYVQE
jgi:hypothetical protein